MSGPRSLRNFIAGEYVDGRTETTTDIVNPATGSVVATAPVSGAADVDAAYGAAQSAFAEAGQALMLDPPGDGTIGGAIATGDSGPLRHRYGAPRDLVIGVAMALADGTVARGGGRVIKNVAGYDLPKLAAGSFGDRPHRRHAVGVDLGVGHALGFGAGQVQALADVANGAQSLVGRPDPSRERLQELCEPRGFRTAHDRALSVERRADIEKRLSIRY